MNKDTEEDIIKRKLDRIAELTKNNPARLKRTQDYLKQEKEKDHERDDQRRKTSSTKGKTQS